MATTPDAAPLGELRSYEVLVAVCGGIAAYKAAYVVSDLVQRGAGVTVAMTRAARKFVGPLTFRALTGRRVLTSLWHAEPPVDAQHIRVTSSADLLLVAPATANIIAKAAAGLADEIVTTLLLSADGPVLLAAAMNNRMWANPIVQRNVAQLEAAGYTCIQPTEGWLACRSVGPGRMAEPPDIVSRVIAMLKRQPPRRTADQ